MAFVESRTDSGLVLREFAADEAAVARALREYDSDLRLVPQKSDAWGRIYYSVYRYAGSDRPAHFVVAWTSDDGSEPYPLSMRLLDKVKELDRNTQSAYLDEVARDAARKEGEAKQWDADTQAITDDWLMKSGRPILPRSKSLRMARDKKRARGEKL